MARINILGTAEKNKSIQILKFSHQILQNKVRLELNLLFVFISISIKKCKQHVNKHGNADYSIKGKKI